MSKELDTETGLYYYGARYLEPKYSKWLSGDPALGEYIPQVPINDEAKKHNENLPGMGGVFNTVNLHAYHYAGNNPVKYTDPDGKISIPAAGDHETALNIATKNLKFSPPIGEIKGYPETGKYAWRAYNDTIFKKACEDYNNEYGLSPDDDAYMSPKMLKAWAMVEAGGANDKAAFLSDPLQVNNFYDWVDEKTRICGLQKGQKMIPKTSAAAAILWWRYKGYRHDDQGKEATWLGNWHAFRGYNGNTNPPPKPANSDRETHGEYYADRVLELYEDSK